MENILSKILVSKLIAILIKERNCHELLHLYKKVYQISDGETLDSIEVEIKAAISEGYKNYVSARKPLWGYYFGRKMD